MGLPPAGIAGPGGTIGGKGRLAAGLRPGRYSMKIGDEGYLWILIALELGAIAWLRHAFKRRHGG